MSLMKSESCSASFICNDLMRRGHIRRTSVVTQQLKRIHGLLWQIRALKTS